MRRRLAAPPDGLARLAILALTVACLIAFAATIPLPRIDGHLVGSDGVRYFVYLPSVLLDGDLDLTDEYRTFYRSHPETAAYLIQDRAPTGLPVNRFGVGPAVLWAPFFIIAHLVAVMLQASGFDVPADGYGYLYQALALAGSIVYGGLGAWFCLRTARRVASENAALVATLLTVMAGNLIYYLTVEPSMSHPLSMFASSVFFHTWLRSRPHLRWRDRFLLGGLGGLMALIRPQDGLLLALPIVDEALAAWRNRATGRHQWVVWCLGSLAMAAAAWMIFIPQLLAWKVLHGGYFRSGYGNEFEVLFHWTSPRLLAVLFSPQRGLFLWHPVLLLALFGLCRVWRRQPQLAGLCGLGFAIQWIVVSSWQDWAQGDAFGGRMFIVCTPIFVLGLAALVDWAASRGSWRRIVTFGTLLVLLNFLLLVQYRLELLSVQRQLTWEDLTFGRFLIPF